MVTQYRFPLNASTVVIGHPDNNIHCYVVDGSMQFVPIGVPGELLLSGPRLAKGYFGRPDLTAEKFIPNPCYDSMIPDLPKSLHRYYKTVYRTGDLVRWTAAGNLEFLGRIDRQTKISGVRIELGEVEAAMSKVSRVKSAVAVALPDHKGTKRLVGYVTPGVIAASDVVVHCRKHLVTAMVPSIVVSLDSFPLLPNGKVNFRALPEPDWTRAEDEYIPPENSVQKALQKIWMECLGFDDPISIIADYFAIGGTSLKTGAINAAIRNQLRLDDVSATLIYDNPTIKQLAAALENLVESSATTNRSERLRSTTLRRRMSTFFRKVPLVPLPERARQMEEEVDTVHLSAESVHLAEYMPRPVPPTSLPYGAYMLLQLVFSASVAAVVPTGWALFGLATLWLWKTAGVFIALFMAPVMYAGYLFGLALVLIGGKRALFPGGMRPGIYPLYGSMYCRWVTYRALHRTVMDKLILYIRRTRLLPMLLRALGARIGHDVVLDSGAIYDPDLVAIGLSSVVAEAATISASFVVPAGFMDKVGCLVMSSARVGSSCVVGRFATVQAGGRLPNGHSLRPYGTISQPKALIKGDMADTYPHFYAEFKMIPAIADIVAVLHGVMSYALLIPPILITLGIFRLFCAVLGLQGPTFASAVWTTLTGGGASGVQVLFVVGVFIASYTLFFGIIATACATRGLLLFKKGIMGPLSPGLDLLSSNSLLFKYCLFKRILENPYVVAFPVAKRLGGKIAAGSGIAGGISEFDAVTIGTRTTSGGMTCFKCVDLEGKIHPITVKDGVNCGHTMFFPGCFVGDDAQIGNETSIPKDHLVPRSHQLQVIIEFLVFLIFTMLYNTVQCICCRAIISSKCVLSPMTKTRLQIH